MEPLEIIFTVSSTVTPIVVALIGWLFKEKLKSMENNTIDAKKLAEVALGKSDRIENNYISRFDKVHSQINAVDAKVGAVESKVERGLLRMSNKITNKLHGIEIAIITGDIKPIVDASRNPANDGDDDLG